MKTNNNNSQSHKTRSVAATLLMVLVLGLSHLENALAQNKIGTSAAQFLGIPVGARATAMGGAFVAMNNDASSLYWNPGAAAQSEISKIEFSNLVWLVDTKFRWFGASLNLDGVNSIGVSITQLDYGEEDVNTIQSPDGTGERWSAVDFAAAITYSRKLTDRFSIGGSMKYISQRIWNESASGFAMDLGLLFITGFNDMRLGMSISNFGSDLQLDGRDIQNKIDIDPDNSGSNKSLVGKLKTESWAIPLFYRVGVAMDVYKDDLMIATVAADAIRPSDNQEYVNIGGELSLMKMVFLRGGYQDLFRGDTEQGITLGGGLRYALEGVATVEINYCYQEFGLFGNLNSIGIIVGF